MKALQLISGLMYGGGQKVALDLAAGLRRKAGIEVDFGLLGCTAERLRGAADFIVDYNGNYGSMPSLVATAWRLRTVLRERCYDVVHTHGWDADVIGRLALGERPEPQLVHLHVIPAWIHSGSLKHRVRRTMTRRLFATRQVGIAAVSHAVKNHWAGVFVGTARKMRTVHNGVDIEHFRPVGVYGGDRHQPVDRPIVIGTACRLTPQKGLLMLIEALPSVIAAARRPVRLEIAGEGPQRHDLQNRVAALGLGQHVSFLGSVDDAALFYRAIDLFVLASESEGLPLTVLEAMASGLPVVATDVGGTGEAVHDGIEGRIVPPRDGVALASAIKELIVDHTRRRTMAAAARKRACDSFSLAAQIEEMVTMYRELARKPSQPEEPIAA